MIRNLKILGLAVVAAFAMSAVATSTASATAWEFHVEKAPAKLIGTGGEEENNDLFTTTYGDVLCTSVQYHGTANVKTTKTITLKPTFVDCAYGELDVQFHTFSCGYMFHAETTENGKTEGSISIECKEATDEMKMTVILFGTTKCTIDIPAQGPLKGVTFTNINQGGMDKTREVTIDIGVTNFKYKETAGTGIGACANSGWENNGKLTGAAKVRAEDEDSGEQTGFWVS